MVFCAKINLVTATDSAYVVSDSGPKLHFKSIYFLLVPFNLIFLVLLSCPQIHACLFTDKKAAPAVGEPFLLRDGRNYLSLHQDLYPETLTIYCKESYCMLRSHDLQWMWYMQHWSVGCFGNVISPHLLSGPWSSWSVLTQRALTWAVCTHLRSVGLIYVTVTPDCLDQTWPDVGISETHSTPLNIYRKNIHINKCRSLKGKRNKEWSKSRTKKGPVWMHCQDTNSGRCGNIFRKKKS